MPPRLPGARTASATLRYGVASLAAVVLLFPLLYSLYASFELPKDFGTLVGPAGLTLWNYAQVVTLVPLMRWYLNTIIVTALIMAGNFLVNTPAGFALARLEFHGKRAVFILILSVMMVPLQAYLIPLYLIVAQLGWLNTYASLTVPFLVYCFFIFLMRQYFVTIPREYDEAAHVDGLGKIGTFLRIGLPLSGPALVIQMVLGFTLTWNSFLIPVTMTTDTSMFVLTVGLNTLKSQYYDFPTVTMAGVILLSVPVILVFILFQRSIVPSLASSGIKG
ncbi:MAG TPA: carbohydrate ABC transporter permease [Spirochaetia bacterium]|nr:carbohydrate ABC transporter permease [Spirochaetia bacterium]